MGTRTLSCFPSLSVLQTISLKLTLSLCMSQEGLVVEVLYLKWGEKHIFIQVRCKWQAHSYHYELCCLFFFFLISEEFSNLSLEIRMYFQSCLGRSMEKYMYKVYFETCKNYIRHLYYTDVIMFLLTIKTMKIRKINVKNF